MNIIHKLIAAASASLALAAAAPAAAQEVEYDAIEEKNLLKGKASIEADKGYILLTLPARGNGIFVKTPDADDIAEYNEEWEEKYEKAAERYAKKLKSYEQQLEYWERQRRKRTARPEKPEEVTRETFSIGDIERRMLVSFGPQYVFSKDTDGEKSYSYMIQVEPGTYTYYGPIFLMPNGQTMGTCYCMGSVKFEVGAGEITDLGTFMAQDWASDEDMQMATVGYEPMGRDPQPVEYPTFASLADYNVVPADLRAAGKMNNFFGILIGRHPPVEGVLAYDRDRVIDVKEAEAIAAMEAEAEALAEAAEAVAEAAEAIEDAEAALGEVVAESAAETAAGSEN
ncbi:hypothetical protein K3163_03565 [Qipengyuania sp. 1NDW9]|uniref:Uncharacterized protein n=1 Tax=Qipengyuania xiapuensis TaxID=2867236 RepID=A0ABX8ZX47_9SPHN|nr:hypothetical protein [Qipengyuania xiapuensis]MBX7492282.1 hypothetical protein [Qipengyuania xiapuensis]QZD93489.1 hypothetical protein K3162_05605 [Qipengyuania xiapuensis]